VTPAPRAAPRPAQQTSPNTAAPVTPPAAPAREPAKLFVNSTPWGVLYVDGTLIGNTPRTNVEISPGEHTIRVIRPGFGTVERTVRLAPGEILRLTDIVLVPERP
jgi:hypothetical protein